MKPRYVVAIAAAVLIVFACGLTLSSYQGGPASTTDQQTDDSGDCDAGDLRESKPDPDCHGLWLGTPAARTKAPTVRKTAAAPKPRRTR